MKIVDVIPITKELVSGLPSENFSYFTAKNIEPGTLVSVPLKSKNTPAIVSSVQNAKDIKSDLKKKEFKLKPIKSILSAEFIRPEFITACAKTAKYFISPLGSTLKDFIPQAILENGSSFNIPKLNTPHSHFHICIVQARFEERMRHYKSVIREEFAKNHSVFFCAPTLADIEHDAPELQKGIENYSFILHSSLPSKKIRQIWAQAAKEKHPILIIATKSFLSLPRKDLGTIILDRENSGHYKFQKRPHADARKFAEFYAQEIKARLIFGDSVVRAEAFFKRESAETSLPSRILSGAEQILLNIKNKEGFSVISPELKQIIEEVQEKNEKIFLFAHRRGFSPITVCDDCQRTILCSKCDTPLVLHKNQGKNKNALFICHKCLAQIEAPEQCPNCQSWRLQSLGIGVQKTAEEVKKIAPKTKIFILDSDSVTNAKQADNLIKLFLNSPGSILIGTELALSHMRHLASQQVERVAIVSLDPLFALPDFKINEKIFYLLLELRALAKKTFLVQTRLAENSIFNEALRGNVSGFYKTELENRRLFQYSPYKTLIKITREGKDKLKIKKEIQALEQQLSQWIPFSYPAFTQKIKNIYSWHILLKINPEIWPNGDQKLYNLISSLPPSWKINVDPESLL